MPPNAQAAVQEGKAVAKSVLAALDGRDLEPLADTPLGQLMEMGGGSP